MEFETWWEKYGADKGIIGSSDDYTSAKDAWDFQENNKSKAKVCLACHQQWSEFYKNHDCEIILRQELEAKLQVAVDRIQVLEFHLNEIAESDLVASNLKSMARNALKIKAK